MRETIAGERRAKSPNAGSKRYDASRSPVAMSTQPQDSGPAYAEGFPQVFGKYVLLRPMARGGMGELFLAAAGETGGFEKLCVVKKVLHSLADAGVHRRFLDEAKVVVRLNHTNLVQVFDAGKVDEEYYLAMELVEGKDLRAVWNRCAQLHRRIPVDVAVFVMREVLRGLDYVHDAMDLNLVHRDISPPNILVGYRGDVKLTDFGLAKSAIKREMTSPGVVFGRYSYLSPEQAKGLPADRRTDIYACAIVLWELLTGRQLFPSNNRSHQEALAAVRHPKVRPPSKVVPGVPNGMDDVVLCGLARNPGDRYETAGEFRTALSDILSRDFPKCNADRVAEFMGDIFAREVKIESRDYKSFIAEDYSDLRSSAHSELISISDVMLVPPRPPAPRSDGQTIMLADSDIVELERPKRRWDEGIPDAESLQRAAEAWVGKVVGQRYRIDALIGVGGMGAVFRVTHLSLNRPFALKFLHTVYARNADVITRFQQEARAATQTGHPNIVDVIDIAMTDEGNAYYVMELLQGPNVARVVRDQGPLAVRRTVHIARQLCRALSAAHEVGIIHRDLKSENLVLTQRGKDPDFVKVLDFGICKQMNADVNSTAPGLIMGSPDYMAPEQGAGLEATVAADLYAVGCIIFEMLSGRLPFVGRNAVDVLMQKGARSAPRVTEFRPEVPIPLSDVVARCLERQPGDRPPSMRALEYELTRAMDGRATAVAAVLGLGDSDPGLEDANAGASMSMQRAAIATMGEVYGPSLSSQELAHLASQLPPSTHSSGVRVGLSSMDDEAVSAALSASRAGFGASIARSLFMLLLGGVITTAALLVFAPDTVSRAFETFRGGHVEPPPVDDRGPGAETPGAPVPASPGLPEGPASTLIPDPKPGHPPTVAVPVGPRLPDAPLDASPSAAELVTLAEAALAAGQYREPYEQSMAMALSKLRVIDPSNDNIARLREAAEKTLLPEGERRLSKRQWEAAVNAFRNLLGVWPDHPQAKDNLIAALHGQAELFIKSNKEAAALAIADELLNQEPEDTKALQIRADMLFALERWGEAKIAYGKARKLLPKNRHVRERYQKASRMAAKQR